MGNMKAVGESRAHLCFYYYYYCYYISLPLLFFCRFSFFSFIFFVERSFLHWGILAGWLGFVILVHVGG